MCLEICIKCKCYKCANDVDNKYYIEGEFSCFNCDECYYYGMDDTRLNNNYRAECSTFKISKADIERDVQLNRKKIKLVK